MAHFITLTRTDFAQTKVLINLDLVSRINPWDSGSRLVYSGLDQDWTDVRENPAEIALQVVK